MAKSSVSFTNKSGLQGSKALQLATKNYLQQVRIQNINSVTKAAIFVEGEAKRNIRDIKQNEDKLVDTARMLNSLTYEILKMEFNIRGFVGTNVFYAKFHELGTKDIPPRPYLRPALTENIDRVKEILTQGLNTAARRIDKK
jgi:HK97 gp10 family phage protein